jgi:ATP-binding cassette subfamily G (WHITE) protein 2 (SNQ2)
MHRQQKAAMYYPFIEAIALTLVDVPFTFVTMALYCITVYFMVRLQQTAAQFFIFFLIIFTIALTMKAFVRALAALCRSAAPAQTAAGVATLALALYMGKPPAGFSDRER